MRVSREESAAPRRGLVRVFVEVGDGHRVALLGTRATASAAVVLDHHIRFDTVLTNKEVRAALVVGVARKAQRELVSTVKVLELSIVQNLEHWCEKHGVPHDKCVSRLDWPREPARTLRELWSPGIRSRERNLCEERVRRKTHLDHVWLVQRSHAVVARATTRCHVRSLRERVRVLLLYKLTILIRSGSGPEARGQI